VRVEDEVMRAKTPDSGRLFLVVAALVVALLDVRVVVTALDAVPGTCPLTGSLLGETLRVSPPMAMPVSGLVGLRSDRARDRALLLDGIDDMAVRSLRRHCQISALPSTLFIVVVESAQLFVDLRLRWRFTR
jgi:hypothetical protein